ncbi:hypothetical protein EGR_07727 [Echinococcus granulosus]|uniref:Uncharacterized protein n=1 Tax=Echinococcus granulosus TaxID=6210 RepID=W6U845_ECHGR|nr:hypothetical protein EGR_07727 [Echinococcus granulosus]EUB57403.1 hypothetical protein EGR_07727 [Echinococcus granulosus]
MGGFNTFNYHILTEVKEQLRIGGLTRTIGYLVCSGRFPCESLVSKVSNRLNKYMSATHHSRFPDDVESVLCTLQSVITSPFIQPLEWFQCWKQCQLGIMTSGGKGAIFPFSPSKLLLMPRNLTDLKCRNFYLLSNEDKKGEKLNVGNEWIMRVFIRLPFSPIKNTQKDTHLRVYMPNPYLKIEHLPPTENQAVQRRIYMFSAKLGRILLNWPKRQTTIPTWGICSASFPNNTISWKWIITSHFIFCWDDGHNPPMSGAFKTLTNNNKWKVISSIHNFSTSKKLEQDYHPKSGGGKNQRQIAFLNQISLDFLLHVCYFSPKTIDELVIKI